MLLLRQLQSKMELDNHRCVSGAAADVCDSFSDELKMTFMRRAATGCIRASRAMHMLGNCNLRLLSLDISSSAHIKCSEEVIGTLLKLYDWEQK